MSLVDPKALTAALDAAGIDPVQFHKDLEESGDAFANQFDRSNPDFDPNGNWNMKPVPTGGSRVPESMGGDAAGNWRDLPENQIAIEPEYPPEYHKAMADYELFNKIKKTISVLNKPVENAFKVRFQYKGAEGDDKTALESRLKGEENIRDGALNGAQALFDQVDPACLSDRSKHTLKELFERGRYPFEDRNTMGDYMLVLQRGNQAIFADQKKLLEKIKKIKKEANTSAVSASAAPSGNGGYAGEQVPAAPKVVVDKEAPAAAACA
jgi:hypothetical protein